MLLMSVGVVGCYCRLLMFVVGVVVIGVAGGMFVLSFIRVFVCLLVVAVVVFVVCCVLSLSLCV